MRPEPRKVAIFQSSNNHGEVIYPQVVLLTRAGWEVHLVAHEGLLATDLFARPAPGVFLHPLPSRPSFPARLRAYRAAGRRLRERGVSIVVLNTAERTSALLFSVLAARGCERVGVLHNPERLRAGLAQRLLARVVRRYLVLGARTLAHVRARRPAGLRFALFYPIHFGPFLAASEPERPGGGPVLCIPGQIDRARRDYEGLVAFVARRRHALPPGLRFVLLGNAARGDGPWLRERIHEAGVAPYFVLFDAFVPYGRLFAVLRGCDAVMPLVHPATPYFADYLTRKTTAAFNMAFACRKPLLVHEAFRDDPDCAGIAAFYGDRDDDLCDLLRRTADDPGFLRSLEAGYDARPEFGFDHQQRDYLRFLAG